MAADSVEKRDFNSALAEKARIVNGTLADLVDGWSAGKSFAGKLIGDCKIPDELKKAVKYTIQAPGKRIRGSLVLWCCELVAGEINNDAKIAAAAIEMVHTYSLVHDDLPAMDNDDLRRGLPTCHKAFGEATAILTGDALLTMAFEILGKDVSDAAVAVRLIETLAAAAGPGGMIAGQMADLQAQNIAGSEQLLQNIHTNKTAKMFAAACAMGAIAAKADNRQLEALARYGLKIGLGFQIADDILDVSATSEQLGKTAGKDVKQGKLTYPAVVGMAQSKIIAQKLADGAVAALEQFGSKADILRKLTVALLERTK